MNRLLNFATRAEASLGVSALLIGLITAVSPASFASQPLHCHNQATGAEIKIYSGDSSAGYEMNSQLNQNLSSQTGAPIDMRGGGKIENDGELLFRGGSNQTFEFGLYSAEGAVELREIRSQSRPPGAGPETRADANFYFNANECVAN